MSIENGYGKKCCIYSVFRSIVNISFFFYNKKREIFISSGIICNYVMRKISSYGSVLFLGYTVL